MTSINRSERNAVELSLEMRIWRSLQQTISTVTIMSKDVFIEPLRRLLTPLSCPRHCQVTLDTVTGSGRCLQFLLRWPPRQRKDLIGVKTILSTQHWFLNSNLDWNRKTWQTDTDEMNVYKYQCSVERRCVPLPIRCRVSSDQGDFRQDLSMDKISAGQLWKLLTVQYVF